MASTSKSLPYSSKKGCPPGYRHRKSYRSPRGSYIGPRCIQSQSPYPTGIENLRRKNISRRSSLARTIRTRLGLTQKCGKGQVLRAPYKRKFSSSIKKSGYNVRRGNRTVRVYPKAGSQIVKAACIENRGLPGKGPVSGEGFGPLRKGELSKYGYKAKAPETERHAALRKAAGELGGLSVYRKLDAVAKLMGRTEPEYAKIFRDDRAWVRKTFSMKAF
jgi:hypothetical protein